MSEKQKQGKGHVSASPSPKKVQKAFTRFSVNYVQDEITRKTKSGKVLKRDLDQFNETRPNSANANANTEPPQQQQHESGKKKKEKKSAIQSELAVQFTAIASSTPRDKDKAETSSTVPVKSRKEKGTISTFGRSSQAHRSHPQLLGTNASQAPEKNKAEERSKICSELLEEFRRAASDICEEKFIHKEKPLWIAGELRDTLLRIVDCEWNETDIVSQETLPSSYFHHAQDVPLPPSRDFWSRGVLEPFPRHRRESVMDPFIRQKLRGKIIMDGSGDSISTTMYSPSPPDESASSVLDASIKTMVGKKTKKTKRNIIRNPTTAQPSEVSLREIATQTSYMGIGDGDAPSNSSIVSNNQMATVSLSQENQAISAEEKELQILKSAVSMASSKTDKHNRYKPWTISVCGANNGTGNVFRLFRQTTSEAIRDSAVGVESINRTSSTLHKTLSEPRLSQVEMISQDQPGTETIFERDQETAAHQSPTSKLSSQLELGKHFEDFSALELDSNDARRTDGSLDFTDPDDMLSITTTDVTLVDKAHKRKTVSKKQIFSSH